ncbi:sugar phosphate isomerase/epimerase [Candidatus Woesearchaeota archaeon]|nr:sugar phosphate isomerase/epimerase [Candidatus Woesearchaeota archaeon]
MIFGEPYSTPMDRGYFGSGSTDKLETPVIGVGDIGQSVTEGKQFGTFRDSVQAAIRVGVKQVELATAMFGSDRNVGAESYGKEAREELREMAKANDFKVVAVHSPHQIGNMSGYSGPERGFEDETRKREVDEIKKAIHFAADAADGGAVVVHTGEFARPMSEQKWAKDETGRYLFKGYTEEPERAVIPVVDSRTGTVLTQVRKNQIVYRPEWLKNEKEEYMDYEGNIVKFEDRVPKFDADTGRFKVREMGWEDFEKEAEERNMLKEKQFGGPLSDEEKIRPEEAFLYAQIESQAGQARGWALYHTEKFDKTLKGLKKLREVRNFYDKLDKSLPEEEKWKIMKEDNKLQQLVSVFVPLEHKNPLEIIDRDIKEAEQNLEHIREASVGYEQQARESELLKKYAMPIDRYAKGQTGKSYAEIGIYAMDQSTEKKTERPVFVSPENIYPEMGYGSHPEELISLVHNAREEMVKCLTQKKIEDPSGKVDGEGNLVMVNNPQYRGWSRSKAEKEANEHIRATLDTTHLGMWWKYFEPNYGETEDQRLTRFKGWYMDQIKKLEKADILGHMHVHDTMGREDSHLPIGQGIMPVKTALEYLKEKGYSGTMISEAFGEPARQMTKTWEFLGSPIYGVGGPVRPGAPERFSDLHQSYFGKDRPPYYVFGNYAPSNDWTMWSQVPVE